MKLRAGTRKSPLAMAQTYMVLDMIKATFPECDTEIVTFTTKGDRQLDRPLNKIGGKGVFVTEIEQALQSGEIDFAVHSAKDLPVTLGEGLEISGVCPRGNYRDMLVTKKGVVFNDPDVFTVGTGSQRRRGGFARLYPNAKFADIRGNVGTRLKKLSDELYDGMTEKSEKVATFLAILELTKSGRIFLNDDNSKIFFNKASKNKKVESDFDKPVVIESETTEAVPEPEPIENILDDEPANEIEEVADVDAEREEASQLKRYISAKSERISGEVIAAYAPVKSAEEVMAEMEQISEKIDSVDVYTEPVMAKTEPEQPVEAAMEEIKLLEQLKDITPDTVFKPNYWAKRRYYWGYSPVGDDGDNNFWCYG